MKCSYNGTGELKQCPYDPATTCRMRHPCKMCDTYIKAKQTAIEG